MKPVQRAIEVWADWAGMGRPQRVGTLYATPARGKEIFSFEYAPEWLRSEYAQGLDPALLQFTGPQYPAYDKANFGMFLDSAPDRWGRLLQDRREAQSAREEGRARRTLHEADYLLGVYDGHRMGALRFRLEADGEFLDDNREFASPPWASLRELEQASLEIEKEGAESDRNYRRWLRILIAPGGSLGGARPKAGVLDAQGRLWIAKFPSRGDTLDTGAWELVIHSLAERAGVIVSQAAARAFNTPRHTFLTRRFDRAEDGRRVHFASAMTLLNRKDGDDASSGASYLELAELIIKQGAYPDRDLEQLWRRILFFVCVSNADDHLRNHGFLLVQGGWALSPAYDMNPDPYADGLKLNISDVENAQDIGLVLEVAPYFRIPSRRAQDIVSEVVAAARGWREAAQKMGISRSEMESMERAFRVAEKSALR